MPYPPPPHGARLWFHGKLCCTPYAELHPSISTLPQCENPYPCQQLLVGGTSVDDLARVRGHGPNEALLLQSIIVL